MISVKNALWVRASRKSVLRSCWSAAQVPFPTAARGPSATTTQSQWRSASSTTISFSTTVLGPTSAGANAATTRRNGLGHALSASTSSRAFSTESTVETPSYTICRRSGVRNVAIVAHVDHGKTTLVDEMLKAATRTGKDGEEPLNRLMDSGELEIERGITITSKVTRLDHLTKTNEPAIINVVDTPGHADFAGEVDRILSMVDGVCLVVDAAEGPMAQTKYVLSRALNLGLKPIVVLNKADRSDALTRIETGETESQVFDLFDTLGASEEQMDYLTLYASARSGWVTDDPQVAVAISKEGSIGDRGEEVGMKALLNAILDHIPEPIVHAYDPPAEESNGLEAYANDKFSMAASSVGYDQYLGRTCTGRIYSGSVSTNHVITILRRGGGTGDEVAAPTATLTGMFVNRGISRTPLDSPVAGAGDIVTLAGVPDSIAVGDTVTGASDPVPLPIETPPLAPPTLSMDFGANNGPLVGKEGTIVTSSRIRARLMSETDNNVTLTVTKSESDSEKTIVYGRGELQLGILIEQMRREGFELIVSPPRIVTKLCPDTGKKLEPFEEVTVDVDAEHAGTVVNSLTGPRKGVLLNMLDNSSDGKTRLIFEVPSRGLLGFGPEIATATRGSAVVHHCYLEDRPYAGQLGIGLEKGKLVSNDHGKASLYALNSIVERGTLFIEPGDVVYAGMVIGEYNRSGDLEVNPVRAKAVNNMRTVNKDEKMYIPPPKRMTVEELIGYMDDDEVIEVTPQSVRLRKLELDSGARQRAARVKKNQMLAKKAK